jgi:hypothetical protein
MDGLERREELERHREFRIEELERALEQVEYAKAEQQE